MDTKKDNIRENIMLCLLAVSPVLIGYLFNVMLFIPVIGSIWMYAGPFTLLYFWGWVGTVFYAKFRSIWKSVLVGNLVGVLSLLLFLVVMSVLRSTDTPSSFIYFLSGLVQMYTMPLGFITAWIAVVKDHIYDMVNVSLDTVFLMQLVGVALMAVAFTVGCIIAKKKEVVPDTDTTPQ